MALLTSWNWKRYFRKVISPLRQELEDIVNRFFGFWFLALLSPILVLVAVVILIDDGRPVMFAQTRLGLHGKPFRLYKFRTMKVHDDRKSEGQASDVTRSGNSLRRLSLDELPQLWNIAKGDMYFVGPRPLLEEYRKRYNLQQFRRHEVRPGLTGLAQVSGRNSLTWEQKFELDVEYVNTRSFFRDFVILLRTVPAVLSARHIGADGTTWAKPFRDSGQKR